MSYVIQYDEAPREISSSFMIFYLIVEFHPDENIFHTPIKEWSIKKQKGNIRLLTLYLKPG